MCDYCNKDNTEEALRGSDGICYDEDKGGHYLYIEYFRNEIYRLDVNYCPKCGIKLKIKRSFEKCVEQNGEALKALSDKDMKESMEFRSRS